MKIILVHPQLKKYEQPKLSPLGLLSIAAVLEKAGHAVKILDLNVTPEEFKDINWGEYGMVGVTATTPLIKEAWATAAEIKKFTKAPVVFGGPHATYYPEETINKDGVDMLVVGEAEYTCLELLNNLRDKKDVSAIQNLWLKDPSGKIIKNELRCLIEDLDALPSPDREIYYKYSFLGKASVKQFLTGRGCPYDCTFCSNHLLSKMYKGKGKYIRRVSPKIIIEEMKSVRKKWGFRTASFTDDVFVMSNEWLDEFLPLYKKEIGVPFMCNVRVNLVTEELVKKLKAAGCYGVAMGIESGNEDLRNRVLKKRISNEDILEAGRLIKSYGLKLKAFNMLGLPGETFEQAMETLEINLKICPDFTPVSLLEPYPKYEITDYAISKGYLDKDYCLDDVSGSIYVPSKIAIADRDKIINLQSFFFLAVKLPFLLPLIVKLVKYKPNWFYKLLTKIVYGYYMSRVHRLTLMDIIRYALHIDATQV